jgi:enterochelin esterase-like enzyme
VPAAASTIHRHVGTEALHSTWLDADRGITVYLPPGRDAAGPACPVLFLHDGQNLFDPDRAHIAGEHWHVAETADALIASGRIPPLVIVGIDHGGPARIAEFTPTPGKDAMGGRADRYGRFVVDEVMPFVAQAYGVRPAAEDTGLGGSSLGGLVTLVMAERYPNRFGRLMVMSPSVWWDRKVILGAVGAAGLASRVYLDVGLREGRATVRNTRLLRHLLPRAHYVEDPDGDHSERSWGRRFGEALEFLFGPGAASDQGS